VGLITNLIKSIDNIKIEEHKKMKHTTAAKGNSEEGDNSNNNSEINKICMCKM
jgi:hypothetical protein